MSCVCSGRDVYAGKGLEEMEEEGNLGFFRSRVSQQSKRSDGCGDVFCRFAVLLASSHLIWFRGFKSGQKRSAGTGTG